MGKGWVATALVIVLLGQAGSTSAADNEISRLECSSDQYLDTTNFQCVQCTNPYNKPSNVSGRVSNYEKLLQPFPNLNSYKVSSGCRCAPGYVRNADDLYTMEPCSGDSWCTAFRCNRCPQASSLDNTACMSCGGSGSPSLNSSGIEFDGATGMCKCSDPSHVLRERTALGELLPYKICEPCPAGSVVRKNYIKANDNDVQGVVVPIVEADSYICQKCPHPKMQVVDNKCVCPSPEWTEVGVAGVGTGVTCVLTEEMQYIDRYQRGSEVEYYHVTSGGDGLSSFSGGDATNSGYSSYTVKRSIVFEHYFKLAATRCRYLRDSSDLAACQTLANLCVLQHYDDDTAACEVLQEIHRVRAPWTDVSWEWRLMTPWMQFEDPWRTIKADTSIQMDFSFNMEEKPGTYDFMEFVVARFALNGTFIGWQNVTTQFEFCQPTQNHVPKWLNFGFGHKRSYECNLYNILKYFPEPVFYDLYLVDYSNGRKLYPVPVRNRNLRYRGDFPNANLNLEQESDDILTRRFFLYDQISSKASVAGEAEVVRYAKKITLTTTIQSVVSNRIHPPVLEIFYEERLVSNFYSQGVDELDNPSTEATNVGVSFSVEYTEDYESFWRSTAALFGITMTVVGLLALLRLYNWSRRNTRLPGDAPVDFVFILRGISYGFSTFAQVFFWFLFAYATYFFVFFKMQDNVHLLLPIYRDEYGSENDYYPFYVTLQVCFFGQLARMLEIVIMQSNCDIFFLDWEKPRGRITSKRGDGTKTKFAPISVWRTIFMANEWNEMQHVRKYTIDFALLLLATVLIAADVQYAATPTPNFKDLTPGPLNIVLRFFNTSFWFLVVVYGEIFWKWAIQDRYITEPPTHSFVDLCTMAKVSVFVLDEEYHGYYLHCRSQHEFADCSMLEISRQLRQEEEGLTTDRGLPGCPQKGLQCFEIYVTGEWKRQYNHIYRTMMSEELQGAHADTSGFLRRVIRKKGAKPAAEKLVRASRKLNAFLRSFVDQESSEFPIQHRDQTFLHRFLHTPPEMMNTKDSIFFPDTFYGYDKVLFYGETWNLILFNLLCITTFDYWFDDTMLAIFMAYLLDRFFVILRDLFGHTNLSTKTLVDDRFLI